MTDTIFAPATAAGRGAVAIVRLSGPGAHDAVLALAGTVPAPRHASLRRLANRQGEPLDEAVVLWLPGPGSYTGEDGAELHLHGGAAVTEAVSQALVDLGLRLADPGEFTRRAFENGRLDLAQAEAVADLVDAETAAQRRQALGQLDGALSQRYAAWRTAMIEALAFLDAAVDFPDEDLPEALAEQVRPRLLALATDLQAALADAARGERVRDGFRIALIGAPNAGKSSLLNALTGREVAIVTAAPGTTRDIIEAPLVLAGFKVVLADMAGLRATEEAIEAEGVRRARTWASAADLRIWVADRSASDGAWSDAAGLMRAGDLCVLNKGDLQSGTDADAVGAAAYDRGLDVLTLSALADAELGSLREWLDQAVSMRLRGSEFPATTRLRHRVRLEQALAHLQRATDSLATGAELAAEDLRLAARALAQIAGRIDPEQVLDVVFGSFCIGK